MTCAQGLLRLLWGGGGPKLECYGTGPIKHNAQISWLTNFCSCASGSAGFKIGIGIVRCTLLTCR